MQEEILEKLSGKLSVIEAEVEDLCIVNNVHTNRPTVSGLTLASGEVKYFIKLKMLF